MTTKELRFENEDIAFHERLHQGYLELARQEPERFIIIDASGTMEQVSKKIIDAYHKRIKD